MNIGLLGAPGAGKTQLAQELSYQLDGVVGVIDNYIPEIEHQANLAIGPIAGYIGNFYVALFRYGRERRAREDSDHTITCGTLIETSVHSSLMVESVMRNIEDEEERQAQLPRIEGILRMLAVLYVDVFDYDKLLYLPVQQNASEDSLYIDKYIQTAIKGFNLADAVVLDGDDRLKQAMEAISEVATTD